MSKIMTDLVLRISANSAELSKGLQQANNSLSDLQKNTTNIGGQIMSAVGKIGGAFIAVKGSIETFKKVINSTEGSAETFERIMGTLHGTIQGLFRTIVTGEWGSLIDNMVNTAKATRDLTAATQELTHIVASNTIRRAYLENYLQSARLAVAEAQNIKDKKRYLEEAIGYQEQINELNKEENEQKVLNTEESFKTILGYDENYTKIAIENIRKIAGNWEYWFGEESTAIEDMRGRISDLKYLESLGTITPIQEDELKDLQLANYSLEDYMKLQKGLKPGVMDQYAKDTGTYVNTIAEGYQALVRLNKMLTTVTIKLEKQKEILEDIHLPTLQYPTQNIPQGNKLVDMGKPYSRADFVDTTYWDTLQSQITETTYLTEIFHDSINNLTTAFEGLFSGTEGGFKSMLTVVLDSISKIINGLLAEAIAGIIAKETTTKGLFGLVTASIGIGLLTALWKSKVPEFAQGGLAYGDTIARVGEYSGAQNNPEVIAPLSKLQNILASSTLAGEVIFRIDGRELVGVLQKQSIKNNSF
jgi:hypothetical protein